MAEDLNNCRQFPLLCDGGRSRALHPNETQSSAPQAGHQAIVAAVPAGGRNPRTSEATIDADAFEFELPEPEKGPRSPNAFDEQAFEQYSAMLETIIENHPKFRRQHTAKPVRKEQAIPVEDWLRSEEPVVPYEDNLTSFVQALSDGIAPLHGQPDHNRAVFRAETEAQRQRFMQELGLDKDQCKMASGTIYQLAGTCAKEANGQAVSILWAKVKEAGMTDANLLHTLLYVSATFSSSNRLKSARYGRLVGASILDVLDAPKAPTDVEDSAWLVDQTDEIAIYHDLLYEPTEQSINIRVRLLVAQGKAKEAEVLLDEHSSQAELRLRAYDPVLRLYLEQGEIGSALRLYKRMLQMPLVHFEAETYINLIAGIAKRGLFRSGAPAIESAHELGYSASSGPGLFNEIVAEMARDVIEIPMASAKRLYNAFAEGFLESTLEPTSSLSPLQVVSDMAPSGDLVVSRVWVDPSTGFCSRSGVRLRLIYLEEDQREKLKSTILSLARSGQLKFQENLKTGSNRTPLKDKRADEQLLNFFTWLDERDGEPFTAIVDGANVGYYMQNFDDGRFSFHQIDFVVESLKKLGERPLVVLPNKYTKRQFYVTIGAGGPGGARKQVLTADEREIQDRLIDSETAFVVPPGFLDDYYWILASVSKQTKSRAGRDLFVEPDNEEGRWPGTRPMLISNDQMRDHKLELLEPMLFRRWYSNFIVNYNFSGFVGGRCAQPEIGFSSSDFFSREIQMNEVGDGSKVWHFPIADTEDEWLCVRIPINEQ